MTTSLAALIEKLSPEATNDLVDVFGDAVLDALTLSILEAVPDEKVPELGKIADEGDLQALEVFLRKNVPDLDAVMARSLQNVREELAIGADK